jgi:hypothetical protein
MTSLIKGIVVEETGHMALVTNILNAVVELNALTAIRGIA